MAEQIPLPGIPVTDEKERKRLRRRANYERYRDRHLEKIRERQRIQERKRRAADPEASRRRVKEYARLHPEVIKARTERYKAEGRLARQKRVCNAKRRDRVFDHYGWVCACCGEAHPEFLSIDHIHGDGAQHRKQIRARGQRFYDWLVKNNFPKGFQTLCMNCNHAKGRRNSGGKCPHERERDGVLISQREAERNASKERL